MYLFGIYDFCLQFCGVYVSSNFISWLLFFSEVLPLLYVAILHLYYFSVFYNYDLNLNFE